MNAAALDRDDQARALLADNLPRLVGEARALEGLAELDDLIAVGWWALYQCAERFEARNGVTLWGYANHRVRGAMIDWCRRAAWWSSRRYPTPHHRTDFPELVAPAPELRPTFDELTESLDERRRTLLRLVFVYETPMKAAGDLLGVHESRASQLRGDAIARLRSTFME